MTDELTVETYALKRIQETAERIALDLEYAAKSIREIAAFGPSANLARPYAWLDSSIMRQLDTTWNNLPISTIRNSALDAEIAKALDSERKLLRGNVHPKEES